MKLNINATKEGQEVFDEFVAQVNSKGIDGGNYKILVQKSNGDWVEIKPDKLKLEFTKE